MEKGFCRVKMGLGQEELINPKTHLFAKLSKIVRKLHLAKFENF